VNSEVYKEPWLTAIFTTQDLSGADIVGITSLSLKRKPLLFEYDKPGSFGIRNIQLLCRFWIDDIVSESDYNLISLLECRIILYLAGFKGLDGVVGDDGMEALPLLPITLANESVFKGILLPLLSIVTLN